VKTPVITFDNLGNATFAGKLTAEYVEAGTIKGMDAIVDKISILSGGQEALSLTATAVDTLTTALEALGVDFATLKEKANTIEASLAQMNDSQRILQDAQELRLKALEDSLASSVLTKDALDAVNARIDSVTDKVDDILGSGITFGSAPEFLVPPVFNKDTAGFAVIKQGANKVEVNFENPYIADPVVNASIAFRDGDNVTDAEADSLFSQNVQFLILSKTQQGFTIRINKPAPRDIRFSWTALAVKDPKIYESVMPGLVVESVVSEVPVVTNDVQPTENINNTSQSTPEVISESQPDLGLETTLQPELVTTPEATETIGSSTENLEIIIEPPLESEPEILTPELSSESIPAQEQLSNENQ
jgi:hypothetical protein